MLKQGTVSNLCAELEINRLRGAPRATERTCEANPAGEMSSFIFTCNV